MSKYDFSKKRDGRFNKYGYPIEENSNKDDDGYTDAIHEALKKVSATLPPKSEKDKAAAGVQLPHQFSFDEWLMSGTGYGTPTPTEGAASKCVHDWQLYRGFHFDDYYCTKCGQTRPLDPSK